MGIDTVRKYDIFASYASADRLRVFDIVDRLESLGLSIWIDRTGITGGASYGAEIVEAIKSARAIVLMSSDASLRSKNVRQEIMLGWRYGTPMVPLLLEPVSVPDDVAYWLEGFPWIDAHGDVDRWLHDLSRRLTVLGLDIKASQVDAPGDSAEVFGSRTNLPPTEGQLFGRHQSVQEIESLLEHGRWLTLTGVGGTGKTRLAIEVAKRQLGAYPDGVWFVDLSSIRSPDQIVQTIVDALPVETQAEQEPVEVLIGALRDKHTLLILDNVEHVSRGAADVAALQAMLPDLDILATSRTPLRTPLEWAFEVPQLSLQDLVGSLSAAQIGQNPAIAMFVECATRARPDFTLSDGNARAVAEICQRLEGLPLAIELAAARVRLVPPQVLLSRLGSRLSLLTRSADTSGRHRTLQETIAWSYDLLSAEQQILFRTMGAFRGASALEAIQAVVGEDGGPDNVGTLVDHSLVRQSPPGLESEPRYSMLETIREYALLLLDKMEESAETHERHARYFAAHSREAAQDIARSATKQSLLALRADDANVQAALEWFTSTGDHGAAIAVLTDLYSYWVRTGRTHDASRKLAESLELAENLRQSLAGRAAFDLGRYAAMHGDADLASRMMECAQQSALAADDRVLAANVYFE
ncbi:MAG: TIR domain-containing protein, partial [Thermomicrobiales bacterium]